MKLYYLMVMLVLVCANQLAFADAAPLPPSPAPVESFSNKVVKQTFSVDDKVFIFLSDDSLWEADPEYPAIDPENHEHLVRKLVTLMPGKDNPKYPILLIIDLNAENFHVKLLSVPSKSSKIQAIDLEGLRLEFSVGKETMKIDVMPSDLSVIEKWKMGQKVVVGGVWFNELDQTGLPECEYIFSLFNFDTKEFIRFKLSDEDLHRIACG